MGGPRELRAVLSRKTGPSAPSEIERHPRDRYGADSIAADGIGFIRSGKLTFRKGGGTILVSGFDTDETTVATV